MSKAMIYRHVSDYAWKHDERELYKASYEANIDCKSAIARAVNEHYGNNRLDARAAIQEVAEQFGFERMLYVLAATVRHKDWDIRFSAANKRWARTITVFEDEITFDREQGAYMVVDGCSSGLLDIFITEIRQEYLLHQSCHNEVRSGKGDDLVAEEKCGR